MNGKTVVATHTVEIVIRMNISVPMFINVDNPRATGKAAAQVLIQDIRKALFVLGEHYDVQVLGMTADGERV